ncbi:response regulator [soil metagenome]
MIGTESPALSEVLGAADVVRAANSDAAIDSIRHDSFDAIFANHAHVIELLDRYRRDETILSNVDQGIASLNDQGHITWANVVLRDWCGTNPVGQTILQALAPCEVMKDSAEVTPNESGAKMQFRLEQPPPSPRPYLDVRIRPVLDMDGNILHRIVIINNVTSEVEQKQKLDALHKAGLELANLETDQLGEMNVPARIEYLKDNLRKYVHNLLHYETIEVRLLDRRTMELMPLVEDGMTEEAANRRLFAREEDNGVTGFVAYHGESYLCPDTSKDKHYIEGALGAKSSLTVPLKWGEDVIGTLNVESPHVHGFGPQDLQFTELFGRELAAALHQLDLLKAQQSCTISAIIEAVNKGIAIPVDEILGTAAKAYSRIHNSDPETAKQLRWIMENARHTREGVKQVREDLAAPGALTESFTLAGKRVLVIDQDERWRRQAHLLMGRMGVEVETVADPMAGLALMHGGQYDAVFIELRPLNMRGYETFRKFRLANPQARVCLTQICVDYDINHTKINAGQDGMTALLVKPFRAEQVTNALTAGCPPKPVETAISHAAEVM